MDILHSAVAILAIISFGLTLFSGITGKVPLWVALLLLNIAVLILVLPAH